MLPLNLLIKQEVYRIRTKWKDHFDVQEKSLAICYLDRNYCETSS